MGDPAMTEYLGGPETPEKLAQRQLRYLRVADEGTGRMFKIVAEDAVVGSVGYWEKTFKDELVYETGWSVLPEFQGRGFAVGGTRLVIEAARNERKHRLLHAFPSVENGPSNAICAKLGFTLVETLDFEFPPGNPLRCNDWRLDLFGPG